MSISKRFQKGGAIVEFAILMPLLLLLAIGVAEFGAIFYSQNILNQAVQTAARKLSDYDSGTYNATQKTAAETLIMQNIVNAKCDSVTGPNISNNGKVISVSITCNRNFITGNTLNALTGSLGSGVNLDASSVMGFTR